MMLRAIDLLIGGPDALSWRDVISTFERLNDVHLRFHTLEPGQPMPGFPDAVAGLMAGLESYDSPAPIVRVEGPAPL